MSFGKISYFSLNVTLIGNCQSSWSLIKSQFLFCLWLFLISHLFGNCHFESWSAKILLVLSEDVRIYIFYSWYSSHVKSVIFYCVYYEEKQWVAKHATKLSCISEYRNMVKRCSARNCQNRGKKGCVTQFYRIKIEINKRSKKTLVDILLS